MDVSFIFCHFELHDGHNLPHAAHYKHIKHRVHVISRNIMLNSEKSLRQIDGTSQCTIAMLLNRNNTEIWYGNTIAPSVCVHPVHGADVHD